ncbi:MAG: hypothetical protein ACJ8FY_23165 [Gemmataceae bacterium]
MTRVVLAALTLAALPLGSLAGETVIRLKVRPMAAPKPVLKYQLLPALRELNPGNPAQNYLKCFAEQRNFFYSKEATADRIRYLSMPLADLPVDKLRQYGGSALRQADWAARLDTPDWQLLRQVQKEGMDLPLLELGRLQLLGPALQVRFRGEVAGRRFDDAVRTAKTMFALARHLGEHPTESANLVGLSVAQLAIGTLEEMVQQPGCPNLYWALTDLPSPLVELRKGLQGDGALVAADFQLLQEDAPMTADELEKFVSRLSGLISFAREQAGEAPRRLRAELAARVNDSERVRAAQGRLIESGGKEDVIRKFPPIQIILLDEKLGYETRRDEGMKFLGLPSWQIDAVAGSEELRQHGDGLFADLMPHVVDDRRAQARLEQRLALLRHVEALRLYAVDHDGGLPKTLTQMSVPLPEDPITGKPFVYKVEGATAYLYGSPPRGEEQNPCFNVRYELTIQN